MSPEIISWQEHKERERQQAQASLIDVAFEHPDGISAWNIRKEACARDQRAFYASDERQIEREEERHLRDAGRPVPWGISKTPPDEALYGLVLSGLRESGILVRNTADLIVLEPELFNERLVAKVSQ